MADEPINLVLIQLRELRAEVQAYRDETTSKLSVLQEDVAQLKRDAADHEEGITLVLGHLAQIKRRDERLARELVLQNNRITALEVHTGLTPQN